MIRNTSIFSDNQGAEESNFTEYQLHRFKFVPKIPVPLAQITESNVVLHEEKYPIDEAVQKLFPTLLTNGMNYFELKQQDDVIVSHQELEEPLRLGCVLSGGQAAGGHNVIMGIFDMCKKLHPDSKLYGFLAGPHGIFSNKYMEITPAYMDQYRNMGGFDMIRSGRHKIETPEQFEASLKTCDALDLDGIAVIGGDDSNTNACLLAEYFAKNNSKCSVIGCPKTIDGDLQNEHIEVSFGFDTATKVYSEAIGNLCTDAVSSRKYYHFVRLMGRSASHIALECALQTRANCCLIGEEVAHKNQTLGDITNQIVEIICERSNRGKNYGVVLVPEGLIEFIPEMGLLIQEINEILAVEFKGEIEEHILNTLSPKNKELFETLPKAISSQLLLDRDPHGNVQVAKIDTERLLILTVMRELEKREADGSYKGVFTPQSHYFGYEGRCALPSNFDAQYCYGIGQNAAFLMMKKKSGYMSCIKNLWEHDPSKWVAAGCPLPAMMGVERRKGQDKPVITKALVKLDGAMFKCYEQVREKWGYLDCFQSPGPIQFKGTGSDALNFMVKDPDVKAFLAATATQETYEESLKSGACKFKQGSSLSLLSRSRIRQPVIIPDVLKNSKYRLSAIRKYTPYSQLVQQKIREQFPRCDDSEISTHFYEIQPKLIADNTWDDMADVSVHQLNEKFKQHGTKSFGGKICVLFCGNASPGGNNIIDGLLKFQQQRKGLEIFGFMDGADGIANDQMIRITEESFAPYRNLGGYDYLGKSKDQLDQSHFEPLAQQCKKNGLTGLVIVGATHTLTDCIKVSEFFKTNKIDTNVINIPATIDGNIRHNYFQACLGFDTAAKIYSQLIGNMLTDSASAIKYWYFIRLMGRDPSHLALECGLKTHPNMTIISEECAYRGESLPDIVRRIADLVQDRAAQGKNYGCVLIPEGLLAHVSAYKHLIMELNDIFRDQQAHDVRLKLFEELYQDDSKAREMLTPWSYSLYITLPDFMKRQIIYNQEFGGADINFSQLETEKLISYFVDEELKKRKAAKTYNGTFTPVSHFFGYQGRSAHPTAFDCSLGSTSGFAAGVLLDSGVNAAAVAIKDVIKHPSQWRIGAVPILALLQSQPKRGYRRQQLVVPSQEIELNDVAYQYFKSKERDWKMEDRYCNPGPIQYTDLGCDSVSETLRQHFNSETEVSEQIKGLCNAIQNQTMFNDHEHLLVAALSALKAAKGVLDSSQNHKTKTEKFSFKSFKQ